MTTQIFLFHKIGRFFLIFANNILIINMTIIINYAYFLTIVYRVDN